MKTPSYRDESLSAEERADLARNELEQIKKRLKEAKRILARDWEQLTPRERSTHSRLVKEIEAEQQALIDIIEMSRAGDV